MTVDLYRRLTELEDIVSRLAANDHVPPVRVKKLRPDAVLPRYQTEEAAGADLALPLQHPAFVLLPGERRSVGLKIRVDLQPGWEAQVRPRSGLAYSHGISVVNTPGTVDSDYQGELGVLLVNLGNEPVTFAGGRRIAQLVIARAERPEIEETDAEARGTARGTGGYGHTGR